MLRGGGLNCEKQEANTTEDSFLCETALPCNSGVFTTVVCVCVCVCRQGCVWELPRIQRTRVSQRVRNHKVCKSTGSITTWHRHRKYEADPKKYLLVMLLVTLHSKRLPDSMSDQWECIEIDRTIDIGREGLLGSASYVWSPNSCVEWKCSQWRHVCVLSFGQCPFIVSRKLAQIRDGTKAISQYCTV